MAKLKERKQARIDAADDAESKLETASNLHNASFTSNLKGKEYDEISRDAGRKSYNFGNGQTNRPAVQAKRDKLYEQLNPGKKINRK